MSLFTPEIPSWNRLSVSRAGDSHAIWNNTIMGVSTQTVTKPGPSPTLETLVSSALKAKLSGSNPRKVVILCKKCRSAGHLTFQCYNSIPVKSLDVSGEQINSVNSKSSPEKEERRSDKKRKHGKDKKDKKSKKDKKDKGKKKHKHESIH